MKSSKISVIVPVYNVEDYLGRCIDSLINQTHRDIEVILIDDGPTDRSGKICDSYAQKDERIKAIHKENGGVVSARKTGAAHATGEYVCSVDGDDWIEKDRIASFVEHGAATGSDMIYMEGYYKDYSGKSILYELNVTERAYRGKQIKENVFPMIIDTRFCFKRTIRAMQICWGIKRRLFQKIWQCMDERISMGEDYAHILCCLLEANSVFLMKEHGYHYVMRGDSITHNPNENSLESVKIWTQMVKEQMKRHNCENSLDLHMVFLKIWYIMNCDYSILLDKKRQYLYPYAKVKRGSTIAVYGAGTFGTQIVKALNQSEDYQVVLWVDQYSAYQPLPGHSVEETSKLKSTTFDYVIIAVLDAVTAEEIEKSLLQMGIPKDRIAKMDADSVKKEDLPEDFR